jgi:hypothetical protein
MIWPTLDPETWRIVGLARNDTVVSVGRVRLALSVISDSGVPAPEIEFGPSSDVIAAGESAPFEVSVRVASTPQEARLRLASFIVQEVRRVELDIEGLEILPGEDGRAIAMGYIANHSAGDVSLPSLAVLFRDRAGKPLGVGLREAGLQGIRAGERIPFLATGQDSSAETGDVFLDTRSADLEPSPRFALPSPAQVRTTPQGRPFVVGEILQTGGPPRRVNGVAAVLESGRLQAVGAVSPPLPLESGERLPFAVWDLPGLAGRGLAADAELSTELWFDPAPASLPPGQRIPLQVEITQREQTGGAVHLRGWVEGDPELPASWPTVYIAVSAISGELVTAGWATPSASLAASGMLEFFLALPIPLDFDGISAEYDVRALGWNTRAP